MNSIDVQLDHRSRKHMTAQETNRQSRKHGSNAAGTVIYFVRHTDVENPRDVLYGRLPRFGLSELGLSQAQVTASVLAEVPVDAFYSSPQLRARQTTRVLAGPHPDAEVHRSTLLAEVLTSWQGRRHEELDEIGFNFYDHPMHHEDERLSDLWSRIDRFVKRVRSHHVGQEVVAVTHGDICSLARAVYRGLPVDISSIRLPHPYPGKGSLTKLTFPADRKVTYPVSVDYYDPNGDEARWSKGWVRLARVEGEARAQEHSSGPGRG
jgi:broad specificity phosphatase PhoE